MHIRPRTPPPARAKLGGIPERFSPNPDLPVRVPSKIRHSQVAWFDFSSATRGPGPNLRSKNSGCARRPKLTRADRDRAMKYLESTKQGVLEATADCAFA